MIITNVNLGRFLELSSKACEYTKAEIKTYLETLWQNTTNIQYQNEGFNDAPKVSATKLKLPNNTSRQAETLLLSMFYPNNLMNEFLYRYDSTKFAFPMCSCGLGEQNSTHIILNCGFIDAKTRLKMHHLLDNNQLHPLYGNYNTNVFLISWSRIPEIIHLCQKIMKEAIKFLRLKVIL